MKFGTKVEIFTPEVKPPGQGDDDHDAHQVNQSQS
jgi:hypothetical protein